MNRLRLPSFVVLMWLLRRSAWYLGWIPMVFASLLIILWIYLQQQQTVHSEQLVLLEQELQQLAVQPASHAEQKPAVVEKTPLEDSPTTIAVLWEQLPSASELSPRMLQIAALAQKYNIPLNVGDYQWQVHQAVTGPSQSQQAASSQSSHGAQSLNSTQRIEQFDMRFTIQTDYATCRRFMLEVLRRYPTMALTGLELRKNDTLQPVVETTLTFSMFIRGEQAHAS